MKKYAAMLLLLWATPASAYYIALFQDGKLAGWVWVDEIWRKGPSSGSCEDVDLYNVAAEPPTPTCEVTPGVLAISVTDPATLLHVSDAMAGEGLVPPVGPALRLTAAGCTYDPALYAPCAE